MHPLGRFSAGSRKAELVHATHLPRTASSRLDVQDWLVGVEGDVTTTFSDTSGIDPMGFGIPLAHPVELGATPAAHLHWQAECQQTLVQRPAGHVYHRRV